VTGTQLKISIRAPLGTWDKVDTLS
jgi:hypothetical protein